jgi:hypothetical protein
MQLQGYHQQLSPHSKFTVLLLHCTFNGIAQHCKKKDKACTFDLVARLKFHLFVLQPATITNRHRHSRKASHVAVAVLSSLCCAHKGRKCLAGLP